MNKIQILEDKCRAQLESVEYWHKCYTELLETMIYRNPYQVIWHNWGIHVKRCGSKVAAAVRRVGGWIKGSLLYIKQKWQLFWRLN